jgi:hypothetical protein
MQILRSNTVMLKEITRATVRGLREEMEEALAAIGQRHGIQVKVGRASFTPVNVTFKVELAVVKKDGNKPVVMDKQATDFQRYAFRYGLTPQHLFRRFRHENFTYTIIGARPRKRRFPILARSEGGKLLLFGPATVKANLLAEVTPVQTGLENAPGPDANGHVHRAADLLPRMGMVIYTREQFEVNGYVNTNRKSQHPPRPGAWNLCNASDGQLLKGCDTEDEACDAANAILDLEKATT